MLGATSFLGLTTRANSATYVDGSMVSLLRLRWSLNHLPLERLLLFPILPIFTGFSRIRLFSLHLSLLYPSVLLFMLLDSSPPIYATLDRMLATQSKAWIMMIHFSFNFYHQQGQFIYCRLFSKIQATG